MSSDNVAYVRVPEDRPSPVNGYPAAQYAASNPAPVMFAALALPRPTLPAVESRISSRRVEFKTGSYLNNAWGLVTRPGNFFKMAVAFIFYGLTIALAIFGIFMVARAMGFKCHRHHHHHGGYEPDSVSRPFFHTFRASSLAKHLGLAEDVPPPPFPPLPPGDPAEPDTSAPSVPEPVPNDGGDDDDDGGDADDPPVFPPETPDNPSPPPPPPAPTPSDPQPPQPQPNPETGYHGRWHRKGLKKQILFHLAAAGIVFGWYLFLGLPLVAGFFIAAMNAVRADGNVQLKHIFKGYCQFGRVLRYGLLYFIVSVLLSFLWVIPALIFQFFTILAFPMFLDNSDIGIGKAWRLSGRVVNRYVCNFLLFGIISFLLMFLGLVMMGVGVFFTLPTVFLGFVLAYHHLVGINNAEQYEVSGYLDEVVLPRYSTSHAAVYPVQTQSIQHSTGAPTFIVDDDEHATRA